MTKIIAILLLSIFLCANALVPDESYTYSRYVKDFNKVSSVPRALVFQKELERVLEHNKKGLSWTEGINHLSDMHPHEKKQLRGVHRPQLYEDVKRATFWKPKTGKIAKQIDWRKHNGALTSVKDQGQCGSCWTFGTTEAVETYHYLKHGQLHVLSEQQILDCTPNKQKCGGTGGCDGGTATLALRSLKKMGGQASEWTYSYYSHQGANQTCKFNKMKTPPVVQVTGLKTLMLNEPQGIIQALQDGPVIVNVDASSWNAYHSGVYDGCNQKNPVIDHVVLCVGYDEDSWIIRNSWTPDWGEDGYIRLKRQPLGHQVCGWDLQPDEGIACKGKGPSKVRVCGTCGVEFHAVIPEVL